MIWPHLSTHGSRTLRSSRIIAVLVASRRLPKLISNEAERACAARLPSTSSPRRRGPSHASTSATWEKRCACRFVGALCLRSVSCLYVLGSRLRGNDEAGGRGGAILVARPWNIGL